MRILHFIPARSSGKSDNITLVYCYTYPITYTPFIMHHHTPYTLNHTPYPPQLHLKRKTAWSNNSLVGCRVNCLLDYKEWQEGFVTQFHKSGGYVYCECVCVYEVVGMVIVICVWLRKVAMTLLPPPSRQAPSGIPQLGRQKVAGHEKNRFLHHRASRCTGHYQ
ncbi:hypothetical protein EON65_53635 [archaeon]|nr:MAG: hypothetical protein EON65_53635 [archaeon]